MLYQCVVCIISVCISVCCIISAFEYVDDDLDKENVERMSTHSDDLPDKCVRFDVIDNTGHRNNEIRRSTQHSGNIPIFLNFLNKKIYSSHVL